jgi:5-methylcytosine-specific restriction endonuclease McrA
MSKNRPAKHLRAQNDGKVRDMNICQICGSSEKIEGHHIIDYQYSGAADVDNIISLCHKHHLDVHNGLIDIIKF